MDKKTFYIEWQSEDGKLSRAVVIAADIGDALDRLIAKASHSCDVKLSNITLAGIVDDVYLLGTI